jgi:HicB-like protein involved in pilus formation
MQMAAAKGASDVVKLNLRLPKALHKKLHQAARANNVSLNTEIINQLDGRSAHFSVPDRVQTLIQATATATVERAMQAFGTDASVKSPSRTQRKRPHD